MKKKIGFIDLFIDEWHANNYPKWIRESALKDEFDVAMAWEKYTPEGKKGLQEWCKEQNVTPASSIEEVVDNCDCICILAPSNPEVHEELAGYALKSGKPVYIDKPFAPDRAAALRMFELAAKYNTPLMSSSALRFSNELMEKAPALSAPLFVNTCGGGGPRHLQGDGGLAYRGTGGEDDEVPVGESPVGDEVQGTERGRDAEPFPFGDVLLHFLHLFSDILRRYAL